MPENKEFEKDLLGLCREPDKGYIYLHEIKKQQYEAGQQAERDKHRWIPVTERLPTIDDSLSYGEAFVSVRKVWSCDVNKHLLITYFSLVNQKFYNSGVCLKEVDVIKWQPLPEA